MHASSAIAAAETVAHVAPAALGPSSPYLVGDRVVLTERQALPATPPGTTWLVTRMLDVTRIEYRLVATIPPRLAPSEPSPAFMRAVADVRGRLITCADVDLMCEAVDENRKRLIDLSLMARLARTRRAQFSDAAYAALGRYLLLAGVTGV